MDGRRQVRISRRELLAHGRTLLLGTGLALAVPTAARAMSDDAGQMPGRGIRHVTGLEPVEHDGRAMLSAPVPEVAFAHTAVGVLAPDAARVWLRTRRDSGWSSWQAVPRMPDEGPDPGTQGHDVPSRALVWTGPEEQVQARVDAANPRDLQLLLIDAWPPAWDVPAGSTASGDNGAPPIVRRGEWLALPPRGRPSHAKTVELAFVHHTVTSNDYEPDETAGIVRSIQRHHMLLNRWTDIGYNFLVDRHGQIFEGRAGGIDQPVIGAHAGGFNTGSTGIALLGDHREAPITQAARDALVELLAWLVAVHGFPADATTWRTSRGSTRYRAGQEVELPTISGHRHVSRTACPGDALHGILPELRTAVANHGG